MPQIDLIRPEDCYDTTFEGIPGNAAKLNKAHLDDLVSLGADGLLARLMGGTEIRFQRYRGKVVISGGEHEVYAAYLFSIKQVPAIYFEEFAPDYLERIPLVPIQEWDLLAQEDHEKYLDQFDSEYNPNRK